MEKQFTKNALESLRSCMRMLLLLFLFVCLGAMPMHSRSGQISMKKKNTTLAAVIKEIESNSDYLFYFSDAVKSKLNANVTSPSGSHSVEEILDIVLASTDLTYDVSKKQISLIQKNTTASANVGEQNQNKKEISGTILDAHTKEPILGVNVLIKGSVLGTVTDDDGKFVLAGISPSDVLVISYIGYHKREVAIKNQTSIEIELTEDSQMLDEIVVVGYGVQKKVNLTGAVATVSPDQLKDRPGSSVSQMLQGVVPGLTITTASARPGGGAAAKYSIRGVASIESGGKPLVMIDGVEGDMNSINPNDIENISVLKDASAASVYGARASFGVILVTTKSGQSGDTKISYSGRMGWGKPTTSTDYETRGYYSVWLNDMFFNAYAGQNYTRYTQDDYDELWKRRNDKTEHPDRPWTVMDQRDGRDTYVYYGNTDWYHHIFRDTRPTMKHDVSLRGGSDKIKYYVSGGLSEEKGIFRVNPDKYRKATFRTKLDFELNKWWSFSTNVNYSNSSYFYPGPSDVNTIFSHMQVHALASIVPQNPDGTPVYNTSLTSYNVMDGTAAALDNNRHGNKDKSDQIGTLYEVAYKPMTELTIKANFNYSYKSSRFSNRQTNVDYSKYPGVIETLSTGRFEDKLTESNSHDNNYAFNVFGTYEKTLGGSHNLKAMVGSNWENSKYKRVDATGWYLINDRANDLNLLGEGEDGQKRTDVRGGFSEKALFGVFGRINYDYKGKYLFEFGGRYDGSSVFHRDKKRWGFFPSGSVGWRISDELFYAPVKDYVEDLKFRVSYGSLGNQQRPAYNFAQFIELGTQNYLFGGNKSRIATITPPLAGNYTWEKAQHMNFGLDLNTLNNRLTVGADYYIRDTKDMLHQSSLIPSTYGTKAPETNNSDLRTKGYELSVTWRDSYKVLGSDLSYNVNLTFNDYQTKITKFFNPVNSLSTMRKGQTYGEIWGYRVDGYFLSDEEAKNHPVDQSSVNAIINSSAGAERGVRAGDLKFVDLNGDNKISRGKDTLDDPGDRTVIGNSEPRYHYGATVGASWFGVDFSIFFQGVGKQDWYPTADAMAFWGPYARPYASMIPKNFHQDIWSEDNPNAYFPRPRGYVALQGNDRELSAVNDKYLQSLAYCRLKNLTVGYTLPKNLMNKVKIDNLRVFFSGENLVTWNNIHSDYIDPEQAIAQGRARTYPFQKTFTFGLDITF